MVAEKEVTWPAAIKQPNLTVDNAAAKVQEFIDGDLARCEYPAGQFVGRGIVISAGKPKYAVGAYVLIRMLRELGCSLPIEVWYLGERERNRAWEELVAPLDVRCVDADVVRKRHPHARLNGFESKPYRSSGRDSPRSCTWTPTTCRSAIPRSCSTRRSTPSAGRSSGRLPQAVSGTVPRGECSGTSRFATSRKSSRASS